MIETVRPATVNPVKLGVVYLGPVCGKHKYTLLEEEDIEYARQFTLQAVLKIDRNGTGACIYVTARKLGESPEYFHNLLWTNRFGYIQPGCRVAHRNGITVDNRVSNLELVPNTGPDIPPAPDHTERRRQGSELYRLALAELPSFGSRIERYSRTINADGEEHQGAGANIPFYECRSAACCTLEYNGVTFVQCPHCKEARYCSVQCMEDDKRVHSKECTPAARGSSEEAFPLQAR